LLINQLISVNKSRRYWSYKYQSCLYKGFICLAFSECIFH